MLHPLLRAHPPAGVLIDAEAKPAGLARCGERRAVDEGRAVRIPSLASCGVGWDAERISRIDLAVRKRWAEQVDVTVAALRGCLDCCVAERRVRLRALGVRQRVRGLLAASHTRVKPFGETDRA